MRAYGFYKIKYNDGTVGVAYWNGSGWMQVGTTIVKPDSEMDFKFIYPIDL